MTTKQQPDNPQQSRLRETDAVRIAQSSRDNEHRRAAALRENLRRRKLQAQQREQDKTKED